MGFLYFGSCCFGSILGGPDFWKLPQGGRGGSVGVRTGLECMNTTKACGVTDSEARRAGVSSSLHTPVRYITVYLCFCSVEHITNENDFHARCIVIIHILIIIIIITMIIYFVGMIVPQASRLYCREVSSCGEGTTPRRGQCTKDGSCFFCAPSPRFGKTV